MDRDAAWVVEKYVGVEKKAKEEEIRQCLLWQAALSGKQDIVVVEDADDGTWILMELDEFLRENWELVDATELRRALKEQGVASVGGGAAPRCVIRLLEVRE
ncbi:MAG: hypothetical protein D6812_11915 [Deltaproteobacteria bacterium]|nr:MAG: hypothetical protein D6812_11915 [Deltaproteobacteria bacterium]